MESQAGQRSAGKEGVKLIGGGLDKAPFDYEDIRTVIAAQNKLVEMLGVFYPTIV